MGRDAEYVVLAPRRFSGAIDFLMHFRSPPRRLSAGLAVPAFVARVSRRDGTLPGATHFAPRILPRLEASSRSARQRLRRV